MSFPRYGKYKDTGVEWLGEVPAHWEIIQLKRLVESSRQITYGIVQAGPHVADGIPYIRPADMTDERGVQSSEEVLRTSPEIAAAYSRSTIHEGDLVCSIGPSFGKVMVTPMWLHGANLTQGTARVAVVGPNHARYIFWVLRSSRSFAQWESTVGGATFRALNLGPLAETVIAVPSASEQVHVADFLDRETAKIDALVEEQRHLIELLKEKRQAVISHAVTKGLNPDTSMKDSGIEWLGEVPAHWQLKRLKHVTIAAAGIQMGPFGGMLKGVEAEPTPFKLYGQENTINNDFDAGSRWLRGEQFESLQDYELRPRDVVLTRKGASIGNCRVVPEGIQRGVIDSDTIRVRLDSSIISIDFAVLLMHEGYMESAILQQQKGAVLPGLNSGTVANLHIALPPLDEQYAILQFLLRRTTELDSLAAEAQRAIDLLQERRTALISAAVTGQIDVLRLTEKQVAA